MVLLWVFNGCGYAMGIQGMWFCYGYLRNVVMLWYLRGVAMLWVLKGCGYAVGT